LAAETFDVDLLIVGAGPSGLFAAYYAGFRSFSTAVMDSLPEPGGQVTAMYPEKMIYDVAGFPAVKGQDLVDALVEQAGQWNPTYLLGHRAESLSVAADAVTLSSAEGAVVRAKAVLITGGIGTFTPRPLPTGAEFEGRGLRYFVPKLDELAGQDVLIVGGGDSAFDWAVSLEPVARSVTLVHRREKFRAHERTVERVLASSATVLTSHEVAAVRGDGWVSEVDLRDNRTQELRTVRVQAIVAALGFTADLGPMSTWGLAQDKRHIVVDTTMAASLPRVFAAGDVATYPGKVKLIAVGFGEAAIAVNNAAPLINPALHVFPGHSSDAG
jgi:thioredoxin reductase